MALVSKIGLETQYPAKKFGEIIENPSTPWILYVLDLKEPTSELMVELIEGCELNSIISIQDVKPIEDNPSDYIWYYRRNVQKLPALFSSTQTFYGQDIISAVKDLSVYGPNSGNRRLVTDHKQPQTESSEIIKAIKRAQYENTILQCRNRWFILHPYAGQSYTVLKPPREVGIGQSSGSGSANRIQGPKQLTGSTLAPFVTLSSAQGRRQQRINLEEVEEELQKLEGASQLLDHKEYLKKMSERKQQK